MIAGVILITNRVDLLNPSSPSLDAVMQLACSMNTSRIVYKLRWKNKSKTHTVETAVLI